MKSTLHTYYYLLVIICIVFGSESIVYAESYNSSEVADIVENYPKDQQKGDFVDLANHFLYTLTSEQRSKALVPLSKENIGKWSNLPVREFPRQGVILQELSKESIESALRLAESALSKSGFKTMQEIILADDNQHHVSGNSKWGSGQYYIAILGVPSMTNSWMLQITGHHLTENISFYKNEIQSFTPQFTGIEPDTFTRDGVAYSPLKIKKDSIYKMIHSLHKKQLLDAEIKGGPNDVVVVPQHSHSFPKQQGIPFYALTLQQQALVKDAMKTWINEASSPISSSYLSAYLSQEALKETYIGWSGSVSDKFDPTYIRIDGPRLWIEFAFRKGAMKPDNTHYHTVWRDKKTDYGSLLPNN